MLQSVLSNSFAKFLTVFYVALTVWWLWLLYTGSVGTLSNYLFAFVFGLLPIFGGVFGIINFYRHWNFSSFVGKCVLFISLGLITWGIGQVIFSYYNVFLNIEVPYPSLADASFILSWPLWGIGIYYLSKVSGARYGLRSLRGKLSLFVIPLVTIPFSYYILVILARGGVLTDSQGLAKLFFDLAYPIGSVVLLTMVAVVYSLSLHYVGGKFRNIVYLLLVGVLVNYTGDFFFSYTTTLETFYSGNWVDFIFTTAMFLISLGVAMLNSQFFRTPEQPVV